MSRKAIHKPVDRLIHKKKILSISEGLILPSSRLYKSLWIPSHYQDLDVGQRSTHSYGQSSFKYKSRTGEKGEISIQAESDMTAFWIGFLTEKDINIDRMEFADYT